jgi:hypothetical protein
LVAWLAVACAGGQDETPTDLPVTDARPTDLSPTDGVVQTDPTLTDVDATDAPPTDEVLATDSVPTDDVVETDDFFETDHVLETGDVLETDIALSDALPSDSIASDSDTDSQMTSDSDPTSDTPGLVEDSSTLAASDSDVSDPGPDDSRGPADTGLGFDSDISATDRTDDSVADSPMVGSDSGSDVATDGPAESSASVVDSGPTPENACLAWGEEAAVWAFPGFLPVDRTEGLLASFSRVEFEGRPDATLMAADWGSPVRRRVGVSAEGLRTGAWSDAVFWEDPGFDSQLPYVDARLEQWDVDGDGTDELVRGNLWGASPQVIAFDLPLGVGDLGTPILEEAVGTQSEDTLSFGDLTADGLPDLIILENRPAGDVSGAAPFEAAAVFLGPHSQLRTGNDDEISFVLPGSSNDVVTLDANRDGHLDVAIGTGDGWWYLEQYGPRPGVGHVYIWFGPFAPGTYTEATADVDLYGDPGDEFGTNLAVSPDATGDGLPDLAVTAGSAGALGLGEVYVFASPLAAGAQRGADVAWSTWTNPYRTDDSHGTPLDSFQSWLMAAGDVDGDGIHDLMTYVQGTFVEGLVPYGAGREHGPWWPGVSDSLATVDTSAPPAVEYRGMVLLIPGGRPGANRLDEGTARLKDIYTANVLGDLDADGRDEVAIWSQPHTYGFAFVQICR